MTNDFMLLFPVILVSLGGIALMLAATCHCFRDEQAAWACGGLFGLAFLFQLGATLTGDHSLYGSLFKDILGSKCVCGFEAVCVLGQFHLERGDDESSSTFHRVFPPPFLGEEMLE